MSNTVRLRVISEKFMGVETLHLLVSTWVVHEKPSYPKRIEGGDTPPLRSNGGLRIADDCTFPLKIKKKNAVKLEHLDFVESARFSFGTQPHMVY